MIWKKIEINCQKLKIFGDEALREEDKMSWGIFGQIVLLSIIFAVALTAVKCFHDTFCFKCKPKA